MVDSCISINYVVNPRVIFRKFQLWRRNFVANDQRLMVVP